MAYLREEHQKIEIDFPKKEIWDAIPAAVKKLNWKIDSTDEANFHIQIATKGAFLSYHSTLKIDLEAIDEKKTRMTINGETPVTTITSMADYGRTNERIDVFVITLANVMEPETEPKGPKQKRKKWR